MMGWDAGQYRIDAGNKHREASQEIDRTDEKIKASGARTFKTQGVADILIITSESPARLHAIVKQLDQSPEKFGSLARKGFLRAEQDGVRTEAKIIAVELNRRADLKRTKDEYLALAREAERVEVMPKKQQEKELPSLQRRKEYCDANRETRDLRYKMARDPFGGGAGGSGGAGGIIQAKKLVYRTEPRGMQQTRDIDDKAQRSLEPTKVRSPDI